MLLLLGPGVTVCLHGHENNGPLVENQNPLATSWLSNLVESAE